MFLLENLVLVAALNRSSSSVFTSLFTKYLNKEKRILGGLLRNNWYTI